MTPTPKEIYVDEMGMTSIEPYDNLIQAKVPKMRQTKYLSEESVKEMLAEKDKDIERLNEKTSSLELQLMGKYKQGYSDGVKDWENEHLNNNKK